MLATDERGRLKHIVHRLVQLGTQPGVEPSEVHHVHGGRLVLRRGLHGSGGRRMGHHRKAKIARTLAS